MDCIFCKIVNNEIPSTTVYEDDNFRVIMDINPVNEGHMLILTKEHYDSIFDAPADLMANIYPLAKTLADGLKSVTEKNNQHQIAGINVLQNNGAAAGQEVPHFHLHIIPRFAGEIGIMKITRTKYDTPERMNQLGDEIRQHVSTLVR